MKKWLTAIAVMVVSVSFAQNEFAATAFYTEFKKIVADAQNGFLLNTGNKKKTDFEELAAEFKTKISLPLSDSGKVVYPVNGNPFAVYYFEPAKTRLKIDVRAVNLKEAIVTAFGQPLYARTESYLINEKVYSYTYFYDDPDTDNKKAALFKSSIYPYEGLFYLSFEIRGKQ